MVSQSCLDLKGTKRRKVTESEERIVVEARTGGNEGQPSALWLSPVMLSWSG